MSFFRLRSFNSPSVSVDAFSTVRRRVVGCFLLAVLSSPLFVGCFGGKGDSENVAAVSSPAVEKATSDALQELQRLTVLNGKQNATLCFLGVSGKGDLGGLSEAARQQIETSSSFRLLE